MAARHRKCPTPEKVAYTSFTTAMAATLRVPFVARPYRCRGGHWHITTNIRRKGKHKR